MQKTVGGQGGCERRMKLLGKCKKKNIRGFLSLSRGPVGGGGGRRLVRVVVNVEF